MSMAQMATQATFVKPWKTLWIPAFLCALALGVEAYYIFHNLDQDLHSDAVSAGKRIATLTSSTHEVRQKANGTLIWQTPVSNQLLHQRDAVATMEGAEAVITFVDHSQLVIEPDSLVILEEAPTAAGSGQIIARLVKGSVRRRSSGSVTAKSEFKIKLSDADDAAAIDLEDEKGNAVFRLIHRGHGLEIIVESGTIKVNRGKTLQASDQITVPDGSGEKIQLPPPRLRKPTIEIKSGETSAGDTTSWFDLLIPGAQAGESPATVQIRFDWEAVPGAAQYLIQVSDSARFSKVLSEERVQTTEYPYRVPSPTQTLHFYFRVASISPEGTVGEFSAPQKVEIRPDPIPSPLPSLTPLPLFTPVHEKRPKKIEVAVEVAIEPDPEVEVSVTLPTRPLLGPPKTRLELAYGVQADHRTFKNDTSPQRASGGGLVPARLRAELRLMRSDWSNWNFGVTYLFEKSKAEGLAASAKSALSTPVLQAWTTYGARAGHTLLSAGPYLTQSTRISAIGLTLRSQSRMVFGGVVMASLIPETENHFLWKARAALLALGSPGLDLSLSAEHSIARSDFFAGLEAQGRWLSVETSCSGVIELGYRFF